MRRLNKLISRPYSEKLVKFPFPRRRGVPAGPGLLVVIKCLMFCFNIYRIFKLYRRYNLPINTYIVYTVTTTAFCNIKLYIFCITRKSKIIKQKDLTFELILVSKLLFIILNSYIST